VPSHYEAPPPHEVDESPDEERPHGFVRRSLSVFRSFFTKGGGSADIWSKLASVGQLSAAVVATVALLVAIQAQDEAQRTQENAQKIADDQERKSAARRVSFNTVFIGSEFKVIVYNRSDERIYDARFVLDAEKPENHYYFEVPPVEPCAQVSVTVEGMPNLTYSVALHFAKGGQWWVNNGPVNFGGPNSAQGRKPLEAEPAVKSDLEGC
jgi:hypothetical protein